MIIRVYFNALPEGAFDVLGMFFQPSNLDSEELRPGERELMHEVDIVFALDTKRTEEVHYYTIMKNRTAVSEDLILERFFLFMSALNQEEY
jgi:hypothetical protein